MNLVIAGNYKQYQYWLDQKQQLLFEKYKYVHSYIDMLGYINPTILFIGTWWEHHITKEISTSELAYLGKISFLKEE